ncbi:MAG: asparagine synthase (glutamine-hydrolyzing), partial [Acidimicrobiales bacterium]
MCGIVGVRELGGHPIDAAALAEGVRLLRHRGPDDRGTWSGEGVAFGHTRLSIIDLAGSPQPMASADGRYHLVFNGEILNYREIRRGLGGYPFRTAGDTETLLAVLATRGVEGLTGLRGQFAFALHDGLDGSLLLGRDRMGVLPLYHSTEGDRFVFASEVKALLPLLDARPGVDEDSLDGYLAHRSVPAPRTLFRGVRQVRPGHVVRLDARGAISELPYWTLATGPCVDMDPRQAVDLVSDVLAEAVREALVADVAVGAYLSGGVDSSLIVALVAAVTGDPSSVKTFAAGFGDHPHDELPHARAVADHLGTDHHEIIIDPAGFDDAWPRLTWHREAPLSEPADIAVHELAKAARREVKVTLSGEGSDELFAGYPKYAVARWAERAGRLPATLRTPLLARAGDLLPARAARLRIALRALEGSSEPERFRGWLAPFTERERRVLLQRSSTGGSGAGSGAPAVDGDDVVERMLRADLGVWLPHNLLERGDRMSMAASLELRPPFLDARLVDTAFTLPSDLKVRDGVTKWIVKEVARRHLPDSIVDRRKVGFRVPLDRWFRAGLRDRARERLLEPGSFVADHLDRDHVARLLDSHESGRRDEEIRIWTLMSLDVWHE